MASVDKKYANVVHYTYLCICTAENGEKFVNTMVKKLITGKFKFNGDLGNSTLFMVTLFHMGGSPLIH